MNEFVRALLDEWWYVDGFTRLPRLIDETPMVTPFLP